LPRVKDVEFKEGFILVMISSLCVRPGITIKAAALTDEAAFDALAHEWDRLVDNSSQRCFFLRPSWTRLWWNYLRPPDSRLFIITSRDETEELVGLAPFYIKQRRTAGIPHIREINFLGTGVYAHSSEYLDIIARRGYEGAVAQSVTSLLRASDEWDRLCLSEIPASSVMLAHLLEAIGGDYEVEVCSRAHYVETTGSWETYLSQIGKATRTSLRRRTRSLFENYDSRFQLVETPEELEPAMDALVRLHQARWHTKGEPGSFALPRVEEFLKEAMRISLREGRLQFWTISINGEIVSVRMGFFDNSKVYGFQGGFDPALSKQGLGSVHMALCIKACIEDENIQEYDFMGGGESYKNTWTQTTRESVRLVHLRQGFRSSAFTGMEMAKRVGKSLLRATVPAQIRAAGHRMLIQRRHYSK
jgi:CelD/BcsL family acetyltransferase involved in cellulose biosynthesis